MRDMNGNEIIMLSRSTYEIYWCELVNRITNNGSQSCHDEKRYAMGYGSRGSVLGGRGDDHACGQQWTSIQQVNGCIVSTAKGSFVVSYKP